MADNYRVKDFLAEHPGVDHVVPVLAISGLLSFRNHVSVENFDVFLVGAATVSALVLTAATFVCTLIYQSNASERIVELRMEFATALRRNWVTIFAILITTSVAPLCAVLLIGSWLAPVVGVWSIAMLTVTAARTVYWLDAMLFTQYIDDVRPRTSLHVPDRLSA